MKRNELVLGEEYVVMAPSQRNKGYMFSEYKSGSRDLFVTVVDTDPHFTEAYRSWRRDESKPGRIILADADGGKRVIAFDDDRTTDHGEPYNPGYGARSSSLVKVAQAGYNGTTNLVVVPLANIAMTRAEYDAKVAEKTAADARVAKAQRVAAKLREGRIAMLRELEFVHDGRITAGISSYGRDQVNLSFVEYEDILNRLIQGRSDGLVLEELIKTDVIDEDLAVRLQLEVAK